MVTFLGEKKKNKYKSETQWRKRKEELNNSKMLEASANKITMTLMKKGKSNFYCCHL